jgi:hypothetical protein
MEVVGVKPRISETGFRRLLEQRGSPAAPEAVQAYRAIVSLGVDPLFALAIFWYESRFGTIGIVPTYDLKNPGAIRSSRTGVGEIVQIPGRGPFVRYPSWTEGFRDLAWRLVEPTFVYAQRGARTVQTIIPLWAPASDGNQPEAYIAAVLRFLSENEEKAMGWEEIVEALGLRDRREELTRNLRGGPNQRFWPKEGVVIHYNGPEVPDYTDSDRAWRAVQAAASYHVRKDWSGYGHFGDGLMYHIAVGPSGEKWLCRDLDAVLWHCGSWPENRTYLAILVPLGGNQRATEAQIRALRELAEGLGRLLSFGPEKVVGHRELSPTSCPGTLLQDFVLPYRNGRLGKGAMAEGRYFPETGHFVGHGFWRFWVENGGLPIFGYPLTDEVRERCEDGVERTVQYFERAVFEWHEDKPGKPVLLRRIGAEAARARGYRGPGI